MINVTKTFLPPRDELDKYIDKIYESNWLTNFGQLEQLLTSRLKDYLEVENLLLVSNGTLAMQVVYKALGLGGEVITSPFSFVATTSSLVWEGLIPVYADIHPFSLTINPDNILPLITDKTSAILGVHVYGRPCQVNEIQQIAAANKLKVIYDGAHAFNIRTIENKNLLSYGDASTISFHSTKLFHTIEGGAIISDDANLIKECKKLVNFGITGYDKIEGLGINCKMNEFSAAMGLAVLDNIDQIIAGRQKVYEAYCQLLPKEILLEPVSFANCNYSYFPILLQSEEQLLKIRQALLDNGIMPRRYFYPSLDTLPYTNYNNCPVSQNISRRILCLPMFNNLLASEIEQITKAINTQLKEV